MAGCAGHLQVVQNILYLEHGSKQAGDADDQTEKKGATGEFVLREQARIAEIFLKYCFQLPSKTVVEHIDGDFKVEIKGSVIKVGRTNRA